jgi:hypothetical protein
MLNVKVESKMYLETKDNDYDNESFESLSSKKSKSVMKEMYVIVDAMFKFNKHSNKL